jgi:ERCC4-related helicase
MGTAGLSSSSWISFSTYDKYSVSRDRRTAIPMYSSNASASSPPRIVENDTMGTIIQQRCVCVCVCVCVCRAVGGQALVEVAEASV